MSFQAKLASLMARPNEDPTATENIPWWMRYGGRALGTVGGFIAILLGLWNCISILLGGVWCLLGGMWQIIAGFVVISCEAPCCCMFVEHIQKASDWVDRRPYWNRAIAYVGAAIPAVLMCPGLSSIFGSGLIFATGVLYGMMALGKKATAEEMRQAAAAEASRTGSVPAQFQSPPPIGNSMHSKLVANAQPVSFTGTPQYDSNV